MYTGSLDPVSNNETFEISLSCTDTESGDVIDFTGCLLEFDILDANKSRLLSASTDDGGILLPEPTVAIITISNTDMSKLCAGTYLVGLRASLGGRYASILAGTLPVIEGNTA